MNLGRPAKILLGLMLFAAATAAKAGQDEVFAVGVRAYDGADFATAKGLFEAAMEFGEPGAYNNLAIILMREPVSPENGKEALRLLRQAVGDGLTTAKFNLG